MACKIDSSFDSNELYRPLLSTGVPSFEESSRRCPPQNAAFLHQQVFKRYFNALFDQSVKQAFFDRPYVNIRINICIQFYFNKALIYMSN